MTQECLGSASSGAARSSKKNGEKTFEERRGSLTRGKKSTEPKSGKNRKKQKRDLAEGGRGGGTDQLVRQTGEQKDKEKKKNWEELGAQASRGTPGNRGKKNRTETEEGIPGKGKEKGWEPS